MSFTVTQGDLFEHPADALAHGVNCMGIAGAGVARLMRKNYSDAIDQYIAACRPDAASRLVPGGAILTVDAGTGRVVIHCASQNRPGPDATEEWLADSLRYGFDLAFGYGCHSLALPLIGGGIGGIAPDVAEQIITEQAQLTELDVTLVKY